MKEDNNITQQMSDLMFLAQTPIITENLKVMLKTYFNREAAEFLKKGFIEGFKLNYTGPRMPADMPNLKLVENNKLVAFEKKKKKLKRGKIG